MFDQAGHVTAYAKGGVFTNKIYDEPTFFKYGTGGTFGVMGEKSAEAVIPLARTSDGDLGVKVAGGMNANSGGMHANVSINIVNESGSETEAEVTGMQIDQDQIIINAVLRAAESNKGGFRNSMRSMMR